MLGASRMPRPTVGAGGRIPVAVGADPGDPVFTVTDLLPHLSKDQYKKNHSEAFPGKGLNAIIGHQPDASEGVDWIKLRIMELLHRKYDVDESDFTSAELCLTPALPSRDVVLDRALVGSYGQDDRVCAFAALRGLLGKAGVVCQFSELGKIDQGGGGNHDRFHSQTRHRRAECRSSGAHRVLLRLGKHKPG